MTGQGDPRASPGLDPSLDTAPLLNPSDQVLLNSHCTPLRPQVWYGDLDPVLPVQPFPYQHDPYRKPPSDGRDGASGSPSTSFRTQDQGWTSTLSRLGLPLKRKRGRADDFEEQGRQVAPIRPQQDNPVLEHEKAVKLIPNFGSMRYSVDGSAPLGREEMIVEYVRRQTGRVYSVQQVSKRIKQLDEDAGTPAEVKASLHGEIVLQSWLDGTDVHRLLGPDTTLSPPEQHPQGEMTPSMPLLARIGPAKSLGGASPPPPKRRRVE
ncbi:Transketolase [Rhodotorula kratochvilovae]